MADGHRLLWVQLARDAIPVVDHDDARAVLEGLFHLLLCTHAPATADENTPKPVAKECKHFTHTQTQAVFGSRNRESTVVTVHTRPRHCQYTRACLNHSVKLGSKEIETFTIFVPI